ncbi:hypothetical protein N3K66_001755 [Trichothecium roseum]|uniref:Uncharacterized protein n=1 Tax=Trichothecium roseum TaxID=47278 RepID=A0ACC0V9F5_9HYPO|nr:hypothetical protein N3K66_001755 [Trichothecium roseum]
MAMSLPEPIRSLPPNSLRAITLIIISNLIVWLAVLPILALHPRLAAPAALSYTLGLRHALDADHISAIDLTTRRLVFASRRPATVGTFFSLGHSTVVLLTCVAVAVTSGALRERFDGFARVGNIVGTSVSAVFLVVLCVGNGYVLWTLYEKIQATVGEGTVVGDDEDEREEEVSMDQNSLDGGGVMMSMFRKLFRAIDRPWKMYPLGFVFGLGFDTSSEIAILGIASVQAVQGTSIWLILIFPILFTSGMCLLDTTDGALMLALYTSKAFSRDKLAILYYSFILTLITVIVSLFIAVVQVLSLVQNVAEPKGRFWDGVETIGDYFDVIGASICGLFFAVGVGSMVAYRPWRRRMDRRRSERRQERAEDGRETSSTTPLLASQDVNT